MLIATVSLRHAFNKVKADVLRVLLFSLGSLGFHLPVGGAKGLGIDPGSRGHHWLLMRTATSTVRCYWVPVTIRRLVEGVKEFHELLRGGGSQAYSTRHAGGSIPWMPMLLRSSRR